MKRLAWLIPIFAVAAWFLLKDIAYRSYIAGKETPGAVTASYLEEDGWAVLPVEPPPGAWITPWGIDFFVIAPPSSVPAGGGLISKAVEPATSEMRANVLTIEKAFALAGPLYSPVYRHPSAATRAAPEDWDVSREDIAMAFERYLYSRNNWRGVVLVAAPETQHLAAAVLERVEKDPRLLERFGGIVVIGAPGDLETTEINCSPAMEGHCGIFAEVNKRQALLDYMRPKLHRSALKFEFSEPADLTVTLQERNTKLSLWLDTNAPKPAEPLGGLDEVEVIEIAPVRRPGETDEVIAERELRKN